MDYDIKTKSNLKNSRKERQRVRRLTLEIIIAPANRENEVAKGVTGHEKRADGNGGVGDFHLHPWDGLHVGVRAHHPHKTVVADKRVGNEFNRANHRAADFGGLAFQALGEHLHHKVVSRANKFLGA